VRSPNHEKWRERVRLHVVKLEDKHVGPHIGFDKTQTNYRRHCLVIEQYLTILFGSSTVPTIVRDVQRRERWRPHFFQREHDVES